MFQIAHWLWIALRELLVSGPVALASVDLPPGNRGQLVRHTEDPVLQMLGLAFLSNLRAVSEEDSRVCAEDTGSRAAHSLS